MKHAERFTLILTVVFLAAIVTWNFMIEPPFSDESGNAVSIIQLDRNSSSEPEASFVPTSSVSSAPHSSVTSAENPPLSSASISSGSSSNSNGESSQQPPVSSHTSEIININTAGEAELMKLTGIGAVKAKSIIEYRERNGNFIAPEEIKNVKGIGEKTYEKIKDRIIV